MVNTMNLNVEGFKVDPSTGYVSSIKVSDPSGNIYTVDNDPTVQDVKSVIVNTNGEMTIFPDAPNTAVEQVNLKVEIPMGTKLYAWKHSTDVIYTKTLPKNSGKVEVVICPLENKVGIFTAAEPAKTVSVWKNGSDFIDAKGKATTEPSGTAGSAVDVGDYVTDDTNWYKKSDEATEVIYNIWKIGSTFYNSDGTVGTEPSGTAGTPTKIGEVYQAKDTDIYLEQGKWYADIDSKYYPVISFTTEDINVGEEITDSDALTNLGSATFSEIDTVAYTDEVYTYNKVLQFGTLEATTLISEKPETDPTIISVLQADTPTEIDYVPYDIEATDEVITYSSDAYERSELDDYEV